MMMSIQDELLPRGDEVAPECRCSVGAGMLDSGGCLRMRVDPAMGSRKGLQEGHASPVDEFYLG